MVIFFTILLAIVIFLTIYLFYQIKQIDFSPAKIKPSSIAKESFLAKINPDDLQSQTFIITSAELSAVMESGVKSGLWEIKEMQIAIGENEVNIYGRLVKPLKTQVKITCQPKVEEGEIKFELEKFQAGKLVLPKFLLSKVEAGLNQSIKENFAPFYQNYQVEKIELEQDKMIIKTKLK